MKMIHIEKKQQTAVEWLIKELKLEGYDYTIQQAKEMERLQLIDAYDKCYQDLSNTQKQVDKLATYVSELPQTEISEHRFTEKDTRFAYMQGYNRGVDGNPNHMESYIEHLKSTKTSQTEISDEEIEEQANKYVYDDHVLFVTSSLNQKRYGFADGAKWYREQLKKKQ